MNFSPTALKGLYVAVSHIQSDERGEFSRFFCQNSLGPTQASLNIAQVNYSHTVKLGAIRGLHFQREPAMETKFVRCIQGEVFDVAVDLRRSSPTFLHWHSEVLNPKSNKMLIIPEGFAHGFQALTNNVKMLYLHSEFYQPKFEAGLRYSDPAINIDWPLKCSEISDRDNNHPLISKDFSGISV